MKAMQRDLTKAPLQLKVLLGIRAHVLCFIGIRSSTKPRLHNWGGLEHTTGLGTVLGIWKLGLKNMQKRQLAYGELCLFDQHGWECVITWSKAMNSTRKKPLLQYTGSPLANRQERIHTRTTYGLTEFIHTHPINIPAFSRRFYPNRLTYKYICQKKEKQYIAVVDTEPSAKHR